MRLFTTLAIVVALFAATAVADTISVKTVGAWDGYSGASGTLVSNSGPMFYVGDPHPALQYFDYGVVKYALPAALTGKTVTSASVNLRCIQFAGGADGFVHVLLQKYTFDNTTEVNANDCTTTLVENIGVFSTTGAWMEWDVTAALQSDIDNGYQYSAYRASAVVSPTDLTPVVLEGSVMVNVAAAELTGTYPWPDLEPRLDVDYVPEPLTMTLLLAGSLLLKRRTA